MIEQGSRKEALNVIFPPTAPMHVVKFYSFMQKHIVLRAGEFGVVFRETKYNIAKLLEMEGYEYTIYKYFIDKYEEKLLEEYIEGKANK